MHTPLSSTRQRGRARLISGAITGVLGLGLLTGCGDGGGTDGAGAVAMIVGAHSNMVAPSLVSAVQEEIDTASDRGSPVTIIVPDGSPTAAQTVELATPNDNPLYQQDAVNQLVSLIDQTRADDPEVDLLGALSLAARSVTDADGPQTIVVIDSGLQTSGALRFQEQDGALLSANPDEVVDLLKRTNQLPDLTGMRVVFTGLGDTAPPQQPLPVPARAALVELWTSIVAAAGGTVEVREAPLPSTRTIDGLPPVSTVPVAAKPVGPLPMITELHDATVGFLPDQAVFRDPAAARAALTAYAEEIKSGKTAVLLGTTAAVGDPEGRRALALARANAVRDLLIELGAPGERIFARGLGSDFPGYVPDRDAQGNLDPIKAAQNRKVIVELA